MNVVVFLPKTFFTQKQLEEIGQATFYDEKVNGEAELISKCLDADAILVSPSRVTSLNSRFFDSLPRLKFVSIYATGYDWVDFEAAKRNGVVVSYCPGYSTSAVADWTISMIKKLCKPEGKVLGIIGLGRIGFAVAEKAKSEGMAIVAWDRKVKAAFQVPLDELLRKSDVISVHLSLSDETRHFIGATELGLMKDGSFLINSAREGLVDNYALSNALAAGKLSGAAIDLDYHSKTKIPKAILTTHVAWNSPESLALGNEMFVHNLVAWRSSKPENRLV